MPEPTRFTQLDLVLGRALALVEAALPAQIAAISWMPAIKTYGLGDPTAVQAGDFPTVRFSGVMLVEAKVGGRSLEPHYDLNCIVAYKQRATDEAYYDGCRLADLVVQTLLANDTDPPYWRTMLRSSVRIAPAYSEEGQWQGGLVSITAIGDQVTWT